MKTKILFIINPISGGKKKDKIPSLIAMHINKDKFDYRISFTERVEHAYMLAKAAVKENYEIIAAVGGDGTVNEIARAITNTEIKLAIIPLGSGNGLARTLKIPMNTIAALELLNNYKCIKIDSAKINQRAFFNIAGVGFDAQISNAFAQTKNRGLLGYIKTSFKEIVSYNVQEYIIQFEEKEIKRKAFLISIANSSQYGNNAHIAPNADLQDGILDVVVVKPFSFILLPFLALKMFNNTADKSKYVEIFKSKSFRIIRETSGPIHLDGEPIIDEEELVVETFPLSLNVVVKN